MTSLRADDATAAISNALGSKLAIVHSVIASVCFDALFLFIASELLSFSHHSTCFKDDYVHQVVVHLYD